MSECTLELTKSKHTFPASGMPGVNTIKWFLDSYMCGHWGLVDLRLDFSTRRFDAVNVWLDFSKRMFGAVHVWLLKCVTLCFATREPPECLFDKFNCR